LDDAFNAHKSEAVAELYAEDTGLMTFAQGRSTSRLRGRDAISQELGGLFSVNPKVSSHAKVNSAHYINADTLVVDGESEVTGLGDADKPLPDLRATFTNVFVRKGTRWLLHTGRAHYASQEQP